VLDWSSSFPPDLGDTRPTWVVSALSKTNVHPIQSVRTKCGVAAGLNHAIKTKNQGEMGVSGRVHPGLAWISTSGNFRPR